MKKSPPEPILPRPEDSLLKLHHVGVAPEKHTDFKDAMLRAARAAVESFPTQLEELRATLRRVSPLDILASFASYGLQASLSSRGEQRKLLPEIQQHHGELLQAIVLTLSRDEWGQVPITPDVIQELFDTIPTLANAFFMQRLLEGEALRDDDEAMVVRSLQERVRMHTHGVRNWGYYQQVIRLCRDLYRPLDAPIKAYHGFGTVDLLDALASIVLHFEERQSAHWDLLRNVLKGKNSRQLVQRYYRLVPGLVGTPEEFLAGLPTIPSRDQMVGLIMAHLDLRLRDTATFRATDLAAWSATSIDVAASVLRALSLRPADLANTNTALLFLDNPIWEKPAIAIGDQYFCPMPQMAFSHIHRLMDRLASEAGQQMALKDRRAIFLERELETVFRKALPSAQIRAGVKWKKGCQQFENDLLAIIDRMVLIVEAKSHRLSPQGLRGAPDRVKRHVRDMVLDPSIQSARLAQVIQAARDGDATASATLAKLGIDATRADRVIRLSVTLDDLSVLSSSERDFKKVGWVPEDHALAPSILIADLQTLADILDNELLFLHYLDERSHLQKSLSLLGDELDFLGLYLVSGFNLAGIYNEVTELSPSGMSAPIDAYYEGREAGLKLTKPKIVLRPLFRDIVDKITATRPPAWTLVGLHLLSCADPAEQKAIERNLQKLRRHVQKNYRDPRHASTMVIRPPEARKVPVMFHLFPEALRANHREVMATLASELADMDDFDACVVFARCTENWKQAFETVLVLERNAPRR